jgi:ectoine hydroxylase-related dioxygenase (phytanoyl-CoA dioxygenase family)
MVYSDIQIQDSPITLAMKQHFDEFGYVVAEGILDEATLRAIEDDYAAALDQLVEAQFAEGKLSSTYADLPFGQRLTAVIGEGVNWSQRFDISLPQGGITPDIPIHTTEAMFNVLTHPRLLDAAEAFVGPEVTSNPIQHVRIKPPEDRVPQAQRGGMLVRVGWHQDQGVALPEVDQTEMLTVWLAITDATVENGCLCVAPGSHRAGLSPHCPGTGPVGDLQIPSRFVGGNGDVKPVPVKRGGALFMHRLTQHASLKNVSDGIRWSFDLRYQPTGKPTGRPAFPHFIARSRAHPETELRDWRDWAQLWADTRVRLAEKELAPFNRWAKDQEACA